MPSLLVRKRYIGDYNHAVLSTRASGTGNSARSLVYADGVLLSNLLGNGATFTPRWGMVTPEEIARVDVLYGPFSAAYPGNAVGAVVDYITRMPQAFEAHAKLGVSHQPNTLYGQRSSFNAWQSSASLGNRAGGFSWWINVNRLDSQGQPLTFATKLLAGGTTLRGGETATSGAVAGLNRSNQAWWLIGGGTRYDTVQDHLKLKLAWDITPALRASYLGGFWHNQSDNSAASWLRDAAGATVDNTSGGGVSQPVAVDGKRYTLAASDFPRSHETLQHQMHALNLKSRSRSSFDWELAAGLYDHGRPGASPTRPAPAGTRWWPRAPGGQVARAVPTRWTWVSARTPTGCAPASTPAPTGRPAQRPHSPRASMATPAPAACSRRTPGPSHQPGPRCWACAPSAGKPGTVPPNRPSPAPPTGASAAQPAAAACSATRPAAPATCHPKRRCRTP